MRLYELTYLILPDVSPEELNSLQEKLIGFIQEGKGILVEKGKLVKKNLPHPIKKRGQAFFGSLSFQMKMENLEILKKNLKAEKQFLRFLISRKKLIKRPMKLARKPLISRKVIKPKREKVELKEIEKKLDEILKE